MKVGRKCYRRLGRIEEATFTEFCSCSWQNVSRWASGPQSITATSGCRNCGNTVWKVGWMDDGCQYRLFCASVNMLEEHCFRVVCLSVRPSINTFARGTLDISQGSVARHTWGVVGPLMVVLLHIFSWFWQWNNSEDLLIFDEVKAYKSGAFLGHPV